jgi:hypothetical protein
MVTDWRKNENQTPILPIVQGMKEDSFPDSSQIAAVQERAEKKEVRDL